MASDLDEQGRVTCPVPHCDAIVLVKRAGDFKVLGCEAGHGDATVRNLWIAESESEVAELRREMDEIEMRLDPVAWVQDKVLEARTMPEEKFEQVMLTQKLDPLPPYPTGLVGTASGRLLSLHGMTTCSGRASAGKSWFVLGAAISAAAEGWNTHYLAGEATDVIQRRSMEAYPGGLPESFHLEQVQPGVTVDHMISRIAEWVVSTRTLIVLDSLSTIMGLMGVGGGREKWDAQDTFEMFLLRLRALTRGMVGIINVSEVNSQGESKGRTLDHRSDTSITFESLQDSDAKKITVMKAWEGRTGLLGRARVSPQGPGLSLMFDGPVAYQPEAGPEDF